MTPNDYIDNESNPRQIGLDESSTTFSETRSYQQSAFEQAAAAIVCGESTGASEAASFGVEIGNLEIWANQAKALIPESEINSLKLISEGTSEHEVYLRDKDSRAVKRTLAGIYGQIPCVGNGILDRRNATPSEYMKRMALHIQVFGSDIRLEGVTKSEKPSMLIGYPPGQPSIVISQCWYNKNGIITCEDIHNLMVGEGFRLAPKSYYGWYRPGDGIVIVDAKPDNFIRTMAGIVPIDLQISQFSKQDLIESGLIGTDDLPVIYIPR